MPIKDPKTINATSAKVEVNPQSQTTARPLVNKIPNKKMITPKSIIISLVIVAVGSASGYGLNLLAPAGGNIKSTTEVTGESIQVGDVIGSNDEKTFKDSVSGVLERGGIDGEGSHRLLREGGPSQTVYLTSSIVDLDLLVGHKIEVWGETFAAQKAGWLMDIGRLKVIELNAEKPFEEVN